MSFAVIQARDFALQSLRRTEPGLAKVPVALIGPFSLAERELRRGDFSSGASRGVKIEGEGRKAFVTQVSAEAAGAEVGMGAPMAMARCPGIVLRSRSPEAEAEAQALLRAAGFSLSPRVEDTAPGVCTVDLRGAERERTRARAEEVVAELAAGGLRVTVGIGRTALLAAYAADLGAVDESLAASATGAEAARLSSATASLSPKQSDDQCPAVRVLDDERAFLAPLPLAAADPTPAQAEILARWGVRTLGALTALPKAEVGRRLGAAGVELWERAAGETERVLALVKPPERFEAEWAFAPPVETMEPLLFILRRFVERLLLELRGSGFVAGQLSLLLTLDDDGTHRRDFPLPEPIGEVERLFRILHTHLEHVRTDAAVTGLRLVAAPARPLVRQPGLFDTGLRDPHGFAESVARVGAVVGAENVGTPELADSHRPEAFRLKAPEEEIPPVEAAPVHPPRGPVLRRFRPAWPVQVEWAQQRPQRVEGRDFRGAIVACRGPWRENGEWWGPERWAQETWQVELDGGGLYLLARSPAGWTVEGMLD